MKKLIGVLSILMLVSVMGHTFVPDQPESYSLPDGGRTIRTYSYSGGVLASINNLDDNSISVFDNGNMVMRYLVGDRDNPIYQATYENGQIVSSVNEKGDVTAYDEFGRAESVTHSYYEEYTADGVGIGPLLTVKIEDMFVYDSYDRLTSKRIKPADEQGDAYRIQEFEYSGSQLISVTTYEYEGGKKGAVLSKVVYDANEIRVYDAVYDGQVVDEETGKIIEVGTFNKWVLSEKTTTDMATGRRSGVRYASDGITVTTTVTYDDHNRRLATFDKETGKELSTEVYDGARHVASIRNTYGDTGDLEIIVTTWYDQYGNATHDTQRDFTKPDSWTSYDPWTYGTLVMIDGQLALLVNPDDVEGMSFYNFDPTALTGDTKTDENGNLIIKIAVDDSATQAELEALVGKQINVMWQYYAKASDDTGGYAWIRLAPTDDRIVAIHRNGDSEASVEQWGGDWDRSKQYVVIN